MMVAGGRSKLQSADFAVSPIAPPSIAIDVLSRARPRRSKTATQIIEQKMTGFDRLLYTCPPPATCRQSNRVDVCPGTDPTAWSPPVQQLHRHGELPEVIQRQGVKVSKSTRNYLIMVAPSRRRRMTDGFRDYAAPTSRRCCAGSRRGEVSLASQYAMRVSNLDKLRYGLTVRMSSPPSARTTSKSRPASLAACRRSRASG